MHTIAGASELLSGLRVQPSSFVAANAGPSAVTSGKRPRPASGTTVRFVLTIPSSVTFSVERALTGFTHGRRCLTVPSRSADAHEKRCTHLSVLGHFTRSGSRGENSFHFTGRIDGRKLKPGSYQFIARTQGSDQPTSLVDFRVLPR
jgi:hypothetical protein